MKAFPSYIWAYNGTGTARRPRYAARRPNCRPVAIYGTIILHVRPTGVLKEAQ